ncbi:MAG: PEP-CTERM sorting domain-containing protein, partial [Bryobacteraceae bacterium]
RVFIVALLLILPASATTIPIVSYDITDAMVSGTGGYGHTYSGLITPTGQTRFGGVVADYSGGSGTLNDGVIGSSTGTMQAFEAGMDDAGTGSVAPVITLYLGGTYIINSISIFGGDVTGIAYPGCITGMTVGIGGSSTAITTTPFGSVGSMTCGQVNDLVTITGTSLEGVATSTIVLSGFTSRSLSSSFSITEIQIDGTPVGSEAPEPASAAMMGGGLATLALLLRRHRRQHAAETHLE